MLQPRLQLGPAWCAAHGVELAVCQLLEPLSAHGPVGEGHVHRAANRAVAQVGNGRKWHGAATSALEPHAFYAPRQSGGVWRGVGHRAQRLEPASCLNCTLRSKLIIPVLARQGEASWIVSAV